MRMLGLLLLVAAGTAVQAQDPPDAALRAEAIELCVPDEAALASNEIAREAAPYICSCAVDRYVAGHGHDSLAGLVRGGKALLDQARADCRNGVPAPAAAGAGAAEPHPGLVTRSDLAARRAEESGSRLTMIFGGLLLAIAGGSAMLFMRRRERARNRLAGSPAATPRDDGSGGPGNPTG